MLFVCLFDLSVSSSSWCLGRAAVYDCGTPTPWTFLLPFLSELVSSFELQHPVKRSLTPKWDLSWILVCLQKAPYEPIHKASKLHARIKRFFLLALATAKRCSEIHALAMYANHLRFH